MEIKCEYCGSFISENDEVCNKCGAVNAGFKRATDGTPRTIEELQAWYKSRNLPPKETTRFFIGENYQGARAFGIYEENGEFIVYKNKDDGSRAVRYKGKDEAYAVNEIFLKLKSEILNQKAHNINNRSAAGSGKNSKAKGFFDGLFGVAALIIVVIVVISMIYSFISSAVKGVRDLPYAGNYYSNGNDVYYCNSYVDDDWYVYDDYSKDYLPATLPSEMYDDIQNYKFSSDDVWDSGIESFQDSEMGQYVESLKEDSSSDDYSWSSSDSWDSDSSDWGSDW